MSPRLQYLLAAENAPLSERDRIDSLSAASTITRMARNG